MPNVSQCRPAVFFEDKSGSAKFGSHVGQKHFRPSWHISVEVPKYLPAGTSGISRLFLVRLRNKFKTSMLKDWAAGVYYDCRKRYIVTNKPCRRKCHRKFHGHTERCRELILRRWALTRKKWYCSYLELEPKNLIALPLGGLKDKGRSPILLWQLVILAWAKLSPQHCSAWVFRSKYFWLWETLFQTDAAIQSGNSRVAL